MSDPQHIVAVLGQGDEQEAGWYTRDEALAMVVHPANRLKLQDAFRGEERPVYRVYRVYTTNPYEMRLQTTW